MGREGTDTVPFGASMTAVALGTVLQAISKGVHQAAEAGSPSALGLSNAPFEFAATGCFSREAEEPTLIRVPSLYLFGQKGADRSAAWTCHQDIQNGDPTNSW